MSKSLKILTTSLFTFFISTDIALAQVVGTITPPGSVAKSTSDTSKFLSILIRFIIVLAGVYALWNFLTGGFAYITSNGDKSKVAEATNKITMSIVGLAVIGFSFILIGVISRLLFGDFRLILNPIIETL